MRANNLFHLFRIIFMCFAAFCALASDAAWAQGAFKLNSTVLDSESARGWLFSPTGEISFSTAVKSGWSAATQLRFAQQKTNDSAARFETRLKEASVTNEFEEGRVSAGRVLARFESSGMNESAKSFLRSELFYDGIRFERTDNNVRWGLFAGGPAVFGFNLANELKGMKLALIYRGERNKIGQFPAVAPDGALLNTLRAAHTHEGEFSFKLFAEELQVESLFQLLSQGAQRGVVTLDEIWGEQKFGAIDTALPSSYNEYRVATQIKYLLITQNDSRDWFIFSTAARTAPRYHEGTEDEKFFRQGAGGDVQFATALESTNDTFSTQAGLAGEYSSSAKYFSLAARNSEGERKTIQTKWTAWVSSRIKF